MNPPKPTALRILEGNPGRRPLPANEPAVRIYLPDAPEWMSDEAKEIFNNKARELYDMKVLSQSDVEVLAVWADMMGQYIQMSKQVRNEGFVFYKQKIDSNGLERMEPERNPNIVTLEKLRSELRQYSNLLGTNPSARTRLQVIDVKEDEFDSFLRKNDRKVG